jgi:hypothetical protein
MSIKKTKSTPEIVLPQLTTCTVDGKNDMKRLHDFGHLARHEERLDHASLSLNAFSRWAIMQEAGCQDE